MKTTRYFWLIFLLLAVPPLVFFYFHLAVLAKMTYIFDAEHTRSHILAYLVAYALNFITNIPTNNIHILVYCLFEWHKTIL